MNNLKLSINSDLQSTLVIHIEQSIDDYISEITNNIRDTHRDKLDNLRPQNISSATVHNPTLPPINSITNLSKRILTNDENEALVNGLDFVCPSTKINEESFISNMELFFINILGQVTDKPEYESKDIDEPVVYKMTPDQLIGASKLRSACEKFRSNIKKNKHQQQIDSTNMIKILKKLSKDKSIYITRPDKGKGVVILDRDVYISKMNDILKDNNTFHSIAKDETIQQEDSLYRKLLSFKHSGFITKEEFQRCRPVGSQPARIYGLPKVHKNGNPFRPILSATGTYNYGIAKMLVNRLSHLRKSSTIINDTFSFIDDLKSTRCDPNDCRMVSFDVTSLFTMVPLQFTINLILLKLYGPPHSCFLDNESENQGKDKNKKKKKKMKKIDWCKNCIDRSNMAWLLTTATSKTNFLFNGKFYCQHNGVAMGSPLGPLLADIFMIELETTLMPELRKLGVIYWRRFVDDTFVLIKPGSDILSIQSTLNSFHQNIKFTFEEENDRSISFLDVLIKRNQRLTTGALSRYLNGNTLEKAVLQVSDIKETYVKIDDTSPPIKRYHLMLSDGMNTLSSCILDIQMNTLVETNCLKKNSIIRTDQVMIDMVNKQNGINTLMLYDVVVIQSDSERIWDTISFDNISNNDRQKKNPRETTDKIPFDKPAFSTKIYRKPTYTRLLTKWSSYVPHFYKVSAISNMVYRAIRICSNYHLLHEELEIIKEVSLQNGYPLSFVETQIRKTLSRTYDKNSKQITNLSKAILNKDQQKKNTIMVEIPFAGTPTSLFGKQLTKIGQEINPNCRIQVIPKPPMKVGNYFPLKDPIPKNLCSRAVYHISCLDCDAEYIGKTVRHVSKRLKEHGAPSTTTQRTASTAPSQIQSTLDPNALRRSARNIGKMVDYRFDTSIIDENTENINEEEESMNIKSSALYQHAIEHRHKINWEEWKILSKDSHWYRLSVRESLHILAKQPELNKTVSSVPLIIYPEGLGRQKPKVKIKDLSSPRGGE